MLKLLIRLLIITAVVYGAVELWYGNVEKRLDDTTPSKNPVQPAREAGVPTAVPPEGESEDTVAVILSRNIFQAKAQVEAGETPKAPDADIDQLERTQLSLALLGTVTGDEDDARAIIRDEKTRLEDLYRVGSMLQGATIKLISRGKVVLLVNGREEALVIKDRDGGGEERVPGSVRQRAPVMVDNEVDEDIQPVPRAVPRRRISFRSSARKPPVLNPREMVEAPVAEEPFEASETPVDPTDAALEPKESVPGAAPDVME